jgi:hypothetical protein
MWYHGQAARRDLHRCILDGHRRDAEHAGEDRVGWVPIDARTGSDAAGEKRDEQQKLQ